MNAFDATDLILQFLQFLFKEGDGMSDTLSSKLLDVSAAPIGTHCILELYDCPRDLLNNVAFIQQALKEAAQKAQSTLVEEVSYQFCLQGVTALALLAESHISIHTWPEFGYIAADVFTCGEHTQPEKACEYLVTIFCAGRHAFFQFSRGKFSPDFQSVQAKTFSMDPRLAI